MINGFSLVILIITVKKVQIHFLVANEAAFAYSADQQAF